MNIRTTPTRGIQKRICPFCKQEIQFYVMSTWHSHLEWCKIKQEEVKK